MLHAVFPGLTLARAAYGFDVGGAPPDHCGPGGMVFGPGDDWLVANSGTGSLFRLHGNDAPATEVLNADSGVSDLAVSPDGALFGSRRTEIVELDPANGAVLRTVANGFRELVGLVFDARSGRLLVADFEASAIYAVDHVTGACSVRAAGDSLGNPNGIVVDDDGRLLVAGYGSRRVLAVEGDGGVVDLGRLPGGPDGVALGGADGPFSGSAIVN
ncbi:MAG: SMP-30/gluconolactonase/LRE family protein [Acidimicrobiales bacterium]